MRLKDVVEVSRRREAASLDRAIRARQCAKWQKTAPSRPTWAYFLVDIAWGVTPISFREQSNFETNSFRASGLFFGAWCGH
jgi:hypothetical protein